MAETELVRAEIEVAERTAGAVTIASPAVSEMKQADVMRIEQHAAWPTLARLSMPVSAEIPLGNFKVRNLLSLEVGQVVESLWSENEDVRVIAAGVQAGWSEFEVEEQRLLVRLTRLA